VRRHLAGDLVGEQADVVRGGDQVDHGQVDLDELREVGEGEVLRQRGRVGRNRRARVPRGQLGDDPRRRGPDVVDMQFGLRQAGEEVAGRSHGGDPRRKFGPSVAQLAIPDIRMSVSWVRAPMRVRNHTSGTIHS
jgi:hypothetical protein